MPVGRPPVLHLHLSGRCNLACRHCYSESGPERERPDLEGWRGWVRVAADLGFPVVSLSGGEPLISAAAFDLADYARALGLQCNLVTNGTLVSARNAARVAAAFDRIAVSFDGAEATHNALRASATAHARAKRGLEQLVAAGACVGVVMTVTPQSIGEIRAVVELAAEAGAGFVQLHPLEAVGRAEAGLEGADVQRLALLNALYRREFAGRLAIHADIAAIDTAARRRTRRRSGRSPARALGTLVVTEQGGLAPLAYGLAGAWTRPAAKPERAASDLRAWLAAGGDEDLADLVRATAAEAVARGWPYVNWYDLLRRASARHAPRRAFAA